MDPGWDEMDLEANIARDRHARLAEKVEELVRSMKTTESEDTLAELAEDLVSFLVCQVLLGDELTNMEMHSLLCCGRMTRSRISSSVPTACCQS
jgi:hypothetical protein